MDDTCIMFLRWLPWKYVIGRAARAFGFIDPVMVLARIRRFSQPSEVQEPIELVRAGVVFQARGLINTRVIQFNLDWVWPFWVEKQFNPRDPSFIPRAYSFSHVNLTHRNWTSVGHPDIPIYPLVDPRGLVTPLFDGWSLDVWFLSREGDHLLPSRLEDVTQEFVFEDDLAVRTTCRTDRHELVTETSLTRGEEGPRLEIRIRGTSTAGGWIVPSVRPYNPEGISFVEEIAFDPEKACWRIDDEAEVEMGQAPQKVLFSAFSQGDVFRKWEDHEPGEEVACKMGMATSAAFFPVAPEDTGHVKLSVPLMSELHRASPGYRASAENWHSCLEGTARLTTPDEEINRLYDSALRTLVLLSAREIYPGPYIYKRFWFRDACLMIHALLCAGFTDRAHRLINGFPDKQKLSGYFLSQEGEWDSNGQVLWIMDRYQRLTGQPPTPDWMNSIIKAARWIKRKRLASVEGTRHAGLLPAGFSAEHFGPNDYYYWDDFWAISGLKRASRLAGLFGYEKDEGWIAREADDFESAVMESIEKIPEAMSHGGIPASPYRRMDSGAIGSLVADYPLHLTPPGHERIHSTLEFLMGHCMLRDGFFQDMVHSGINIYLTLALAQSLLRMGDSRFRRLVRACARLASPTGQWPEAVHPFTGGGCMGDGQHGWAAAEWVLMIRNMFVREEGEGLILGSGLSPEWLKGNTTIRFGPTPTPHGPLSLEISGKNGRRVLQVLGSWRENLPVMDVQVPGFHKARMEDPDKPLELQSL